MSLIRCEFKGEDTHLLLHLERSYYEPEETLKKINSNNSHNRIEIIQTRIDVVDLDLYIDNKVLRGLRMENVQLDVVDVGDYNHGSFNIIVEHGSVSVFELEVNNSGIAGRILIQKTSPSISGKFQFENTVFDEMHLSSLMLAASISFDNCTFTKALCVDARRFFQFKILQSSINVPTDPEKDTCKVKTYRSFR